MKVAALYSVCCSPLSWGQASVVCLLSFQCAMTVDIGSGDVDILDDKWHPIAGVFDAATDMSYVYKDGVQVRSNSTPGPIAYTTGDGFTVGSMMAERNFKGTIDDVRVYNRSLTDAEVAYLADPSPGDGVLHFPPSPAELYSAEPLGSQRIDLKDYAELASTWLEELLWPQP